MQASLIRARTSHFAFASTKIGAKSPTTQSPSLEPSLPPRRPEVSVVSAKPGMVASPTAIEGLPLRLSRDAGAYYCEHLFYFSQVAMQALHGSDQPNVGFLHVPIGGGDPMTFNHIVASALRGMHANAPSSDDEPTRILLTGFGPFDGRSSNPTGDFVASEERMLACAQEAFPGATVAVSCDETGSMILSLQWLDADATVRNIEILAHTFAVEDATLNPDDAGSVQGIIASFRPDAAIHLGQGRFEFEVETIASDANLADFQHTEAEATEVLPENLALFRAILDGHRAITTTR